ncbi:MULTISPECIES: nucleotidyltransferase domain-containing protein [Cyanophyceae]|uniref:nucleotidyltransferase domain-containing protein n=1 Tax=Cyanophyceae TaxID=3028117 RepID=UPI001681C7B1|nr:nucleotidyltransferase domain-containing protein [Trichocoleus sp. FACHB-40]MBD2003014.1 nucleotidyltransferase domain-containing protein [Trichocoleus sp. FACHB-40]
MTNITLTASTGVEKVDAIACEIIGKVGESFPGRIRGYYLEGSYADGTAVATSDIDLRVVFKGSLTSAERQEFAQISDECQKNTSIELGITADSEEALFRIGAVRFQKGTLLIYGEDIRPLVPIKPIDSYTLDSMHFPYRLFAQMRGNPEVLTFPLDYPDPEGEFYGCDRRQMRASDGTIHYGTKDLVLNVLCPATALIALDAGQYVVTKRECVIQYRKWINDEWTALVEDIYEQCRNHWNYRVPEAEADRKQLREYCKSALAFENYFLWRYKAFLLAELQHPDEFRQLYAVKRLGQIIYPDQAVRLALENVKKGIRNSDA